MNFPIRVTRLPSRRGVYALFFVSGFTALVFEVVWAKQACLIFGNTTMASAVVVASFLVGLALGSHWAGRRADGLPPPAALGLYGLLEAGIGLYALAYPFLTRLCGPGYADAYNLLLHDFLQLSLVRFALSFSLLAVPTFLMGATFPFLARFVDAGAGEREGAVGRLYAMNLTGAAAGAFAAGFALIPALGLGGTSRLAAAANLGIGLYAWLAARGAGSSIAVVRAGERATDWRGARPDAAWVAFLLAVHGFSAFVVQIIWMRVMALILGSSTYCFSTVLVTFLAGLGLGTFAVGRAVRAGVGATLPRLGYLEMAAGFSILAFIPVFEGLIFLYLKWADAIQGSMGSVFVAQFLFCVIGMIVPCFLIGLVFPASMYALGDPKRLGRWLGTIYAVNTLGGVLGAALTAFALIRWLGLNGSLAAAGLLSLAAGAIVVMRHTPDAQAFRKSLVRVAAALVVSVLFALYPWDKNLFGAGVYLYSSTWQDEAKLGRRVLQEAMKATHQILYYRDGISSTVTVFQQKAGAMRTKSLRVNGKTDASTVGDMDTQLYLGYLPMFAHLKPERVLVIGLGAGITLKAVAQFPETRRIDCVEIEPAVVEANRYFETENNGVLKDPRVKMILGDGRNHVQFFRGKYDVIISEPSNPWVSGVSSLFSRENYQAALERLRPGGVFCQWFHAYQMSQDDFAMIARTFAAVFPQVNLYRVSTGDYILLGSREPIEFDLTRIERAMESTPEMRSDLTHFSRHGAHFVIGTFLMSDRDLRRLLEEGPARLNTDDRLRLEYSAPMHLYASTTGTIARWLFGFERGDWYPAIAASGLDRALADPSLAPSLVRNGTTALMGGDYRAALEYLGRAHRLVPDNPDIRFAIARTYERQGRFDESRAMYEPLVELPGWERRAKTSLERVRLKKEMEANPIVKRDPRTYNLLAGLSFVSGDMVETEELMRQAINFDPAYGKNYSDFASFYLLKDFFPEGKQMLEKARVLDDPASPSLARAESIWKMAASRAASAEDTLAGRAYAQAGDYRRAAERLERAVQANPKNLLAHAVLARAAAKLGDEPRARRHLAEAEKLRALAEAASGSAERKSPVEPANP